MVRTRLSPRCWATSRVSVLATASSLISACRALNRSGIEPRGNSTSTTGPMMRTTRPSADPVSAPVGEVTAAVIVVGSLPLWVDRSVGQSAGAADDLADLLGDLRLAELVGLTGQRRGQFLGVVGGRLHGGASRRRLGRR